MTLDVYFRDDGVLILSARTYILKFKYAYRLSITIYLETLDISVKIFIAVIVFRLHRDTLPLTYVIDLYVLNPCCLVAKIVNIGYIVAALSLTLIILIVCEIFRYFVKYNRDQL